MMMVVGYISCNIAKKEITIW